MATNEQHIRCPLVVWHSKKHNFEKKKKKQMTRKFTPEKLSKNKANFFFLPKNSRFVQNSGYQNPTKPSCNETPRSLLDLKKWALGARRLAHGARVGQSALGAQVGQSSLGARRLSKESTLGARRMELG